MLRWLLVVPVFALLVASVVAAHYYIALRMVLDLGLASPWRELGCALVALGFASLIAQPIGERLLPPRLSRFIAWPASLWMAIGFWLLLALGLSELVAAAGGPVGTARALWVGGLVLLASAVALRNGLAGPVLKRVEIPLKAWPQELDGYVIAQISDIHIGSVLDRRFAQELTERVNALEPDLIAVTGDLVDGPPGHLEEEVEPFRGLHARDGVFFVTGNHDFYSGADAWAALARGLGMRVLRNERVFIDAAAGTSSRFEVAGVDDHRSRLLPGPGGEDLDATFEGRDPSEPGALILLAHDPATFKAAHTLGVDLQLSGHTHGGQIWPFHYLVRLATPFVAGRYRRASAELYVSRGTGFWGPPMRLFAPAEITEIRLRSAA